LISTEGIKPFPVKIICNTKFGKLVSDCEFKFCVEYVDICIVTTELDEANWNNFKNNIYDFSKLKGIHFYDHYNFQAMEESSFYKPGPELEIFYTLWSNRIQFLKSHGIQILNEEEFNSKTAELSKNLKWTFHFGF